MGGKGVGTSRVARLRRMSWLENKGISSSLETRDSRAMISETKYRSSRILKSYNFAAASPNLSLNLFIEGSLSNLTGI